jgi:quercetin dioxygenase-like cupin family protein
MATREDLVLTDSARVAEIALSSGEESPWHTHSDIVEHVFCLAGKIEVHCLDPDAAVKLRAGEKLEIQPLRPHRITNYTGAESKYLLVQSGTYDFIHRDS